MNYRTPTIEEYDAILDLWEICDIPYRPAGRDARANVATELKEHPDYWHGAYDGDRLVGIVVGTDDGRKGWINRLAVHPEDRNRGIGTTLVERLEAAFDANGIDVIAALIEGENEQSRTFFADHGYESADVQYYSKRRNDHV